MSVNEADSEATQETAEEVQSILSPEVMGSINGKVTLEVQQVLSRRDQLGSGSLTATLENGRFLIEPLTLNIPGGSVDVGFAIEPTESDVALEARAKIEQLDYGILARRIDPKRDLRGFISVDVDIKTRGERLDDIMDNSNGHIDFAVVPEGLEADIFDLWAVNVFVAMMPSLDSGPKSEVNCVIGRFAINEGVMRPTALLIDSTNIQASGDGTIDFKADTIDFTASPQPKQPQMFSVQTPVRVQGRLSDISVGLGSGALLGTIFRMVTSPVVVPFQWIFTENEPPDGHVACQRAWGRTTAQPLPPES